MRYLFILNPGSGGGKSKEKFKKIFTFIQKSNLNFDYKLTNTLEEAYTHSVEGNIKGYDVIVAVGGDGTINRVINGFYDSLGKRISTSKLAVIHTGTSPDFCKSYHIPLGIDQALNTVLSGKSVKIPIGKITYTCVYDKALEGLPLKKCHRNEIIKVNYFGCCANIGLGAAVARGANTGIRNSIGDVAGTFISLIKTLLGYRPVDFLVSYDGQKQVFKNVYNIFVGKTTYIASGIKVKNQLIPGDNRFYSLIIKNIGFANLVSVLRKLYSGKGFANNHTMFLQYAQQIEVYGSSGNNELEFDGDPRGFLPCVIEPAHDHLDLIGGIDET